MKYLFLWLEAPLQSWGSDSRFDFRKTMDAPTKSGLFGLLLAASGDSGSQEELLAQMADAPLSVVVFDGFSPRLVDYHMIGNGYKKDAPWEELHMLHNSANIVPKISGYVVSRQTYREYLQDRPFAVVLGLPDALADKFASALQSPVYDLYLGRKCCSPTEFIFQGVFGSEAQAFRALEQFAAEKKQTPRFLYTDAVPSEEDAFLVNDVPVRFGQHKLYRDRWVVKRDWMPIPNSTD